MIARLSKTSIAFQRSRTGDVSSVAVHILALFARNEGYWAARTSTEIRVSGSKSGIDNVSRDTVSSLSRRAMKYKNMRDQKSVMKGARQRLTVVARTKSK